MAVRKKIAVKKAAPKTKKIGNGFPTYVVIWEKGRFSDDIQGFKTEKEVVDYIEDVDDFDVFNGKVFKIAYVEEFDVIKQNYSLKSKNKS